MTTSTATITESSLYETPRVRTALETKVTKLDFFEDVHFLGDKDGKVVIRSPPTFQNVEEELSYQKQHLAAAFRVFAKQGFDEGVAGHISLRDPLNPGM